MRNPKNGYRPVRGAARERGSVYILVLGASLLIATIGVSSLLVVRVQRRAVSITADQIQAREAARAGIDHVMGVIEDDDTGVLWRAHLNNDVYLDQDFAGGTFSVSGTDPVDGILINDRVNPVVLSGIGEYGGARYILSVTLDSDGTIQPGTWSRVVQ